MKKSIFLTLVVCSMALAEPSHFVVKQMFTAIEKVDAHVVKTLMNEYQFQSEPDLMNRFLISARDVVEEQKGYISLTSSRFDLLTMAAGLGLCGISAMLGMSKSPSGSGFQFLEPGEVGFDMAEPTWFQKHRKKIEAAPLLAIGSYLTKRGLYCEHAKKRFRSAQDILEYLEMVGLVETLVVEKEAGEVSLEEKTNWVDSLTAKGKALIARLTSGSVD